MAKRENENEPSQQALPDEEFVPGPLDEPSEVDDAGVTDDDDDADDEDDDLVDDEDDDGTTDGN